MAEAGEKGARRAPLTRELILAEALRLADEEGLDGLSLRALGKRLGVTQTAFYRHVPTKAALVDGVVELVWAEVLRDLDVRLVAPSASAGPEGSGADGGEGRTGEKDAAPRPPLDGWRGVFERYGVRLREVLLSHPNAVLAVLTHPIASPGQFAETATALARLSAGGYRIGPQTLGLITAVTVYVTGFVAAEVAPPAGGDGTDAGPEALAAALASCPDVERAALTSLFAAHDQLSMADQFLPGLRALLLGWPA